MGPPFGKSQISHAPPPYSTCLEEAAGHGASSLLGDRPPVAVQFPDRVHGETPPHDLACVIKVNRTSDASAIDSLGSHMLVWTADGITSHNTQCLVALIPLL